MIYITERKSNIKVNAQEVYKISDKKCILDNPNEFWKLYLDKDGIEDPNSDLVIINYGYSIDNGQVTAQVYWRNKVWSGLNYDENKLFEALTLTKRA